MAGYIISDVLHSLHLDVWLCVRCVVCGVRVALDSAGLMTKSGIPKPGWRGFQLLAGAGNKRVPATVVEHKGGEEPHIVTVQQSGGVGSASSTAVAKPACLQGGMQGGDIHVANMTIAAAADWCTKDGSKCGGFVATGQYVAV